MFPNLIIYTQYQVRCKSGRKGKVSGCQMASLSSVPTSCRFWNMKLVWWLWISNLCSHCLNNSWAYMNIFCIVKVKILGVLSHMSTNYVDHGAYNGYHISSHSPISLKRMSFWCVLWHPLLTTNHSNRLSYLEKFLCMKGPLTLSIIRFEQCSPEMLCLMNN